MPEASDASGSWADTAVPVSAEELPDLEAMLVDAPAAAEGRQGGKGQSE